MKKLLAIMLCLVVAFCMFGCGQKQGDTATDDGTAEATKVIPLGGDLPDLELKGSVYGDYEKIETPAKLQEAYNAASLDVYYSENSDVPYILVYRWSDVDSTLEEFTEMALGVTTPNTFYGTYDYHGIPATVFYTSSDYIKEMPFDGFYYISCISIADGDDFVAINFYTASEEIALGDSGKYLWIPKGLESDSSEEDMAANNAYVSGGYEASYYMPYIYVGEESDSYESLTWFWGESFPDGLPVDKATYDGWVSSGWDEESVAAYYKAFTLDLEGSKSIEVDGCPINYYYGTHTDGDRTIGAVDAYISIGDKCYNIWLDTALDPAPQYALSIYNSLHSK